MLIDAGALPQGRASINAHASSLAFELTSGAPSGDRELRVGAGALAKIGAELGAAPHRILPLLSKILSALNWGPRLWFSGQRRDALVNGPSEFPSALSISTAGAKI